MSKPERSRRRLVWIAGGSLIALCYGIAALNAACGDNNQDVKAPLDPAEAGPVDTSNFALGDASTTGVPAVPDPTATVTTSATHLTPYTAPTESVAKPPPRPKPTTAPTLKEPPPPKPDSPPPGRKKI